MYSRTKYHFAKFSTNRGGSWSAAARRLSSRGGRVAGGGQLLREVAPVARAQAVEVGVVHPRRALDEHHRRGVEAAAARVGEQQRDARVALGVVGLLRVADAGRDVDAALAVVVVRRERPRD